MGILLFDPACFYYSDEWSFTVLLVMSRSYELYSDHQSFVCGHDTRNEGGQTKERERAMESKQRHTTPGTTSVHGDICRGPSEFVDRATVTARLRFSQLHSKTVTLSSQSSPLEVHGSPRAARALLSRRIGDVTPGVASFHSAYGGNCALYGLRRMSNVDSSLMSILQTAITAAFNGTSLV